MPICDSCSQQFSRVYYRDGERFQAGSRTICFKCKPIKPKKLKQFISCVQCGNSTKNDKFCSSSCAAKYNNTHLPPEKRRQKEGKCAVCAKVISSSRKYCHDCARCKTTMKTEQENTTLWDISKDKNIFIRNNRVRELSRKWYVTSDKPKYCVKCGYDLHFEVCHIKPIKLFKLTDLIGVINHLDNLIALCRNCHWELDNGVCSIEDILEPTEVESVSAN